MYSDAAQCDDELLLPSFHMFITIVLVTRVGGSLLTVSAKQALCVSFSFNKRVESKFLEPQV